MNREAVDALLDTIDGALGDGWLSDDAMRWVPEDGREERPPEAPTVRDVEFFDLAPRASGMRTVLAEVQRMRRMFDEQQQRIYQEMTAETDAFDRLGQFADGARASWTFIDETHSWTPEQLNAVGALASRQVRTSDALTRGVRVYDRGSYVGRVQSVERGPDGFGFTATVIPDHLAPYYETIQSTMRKLSRLLHESRAESARRRHITHQMRIMSRRAARRRRRG